MKAAWLSTYYLLPTEHADSTTDVLWLSGGAGPTTHYRHRCRLAFLLPTSYYYLLSTDYYLEVREPRYRLAFLLPLLTTHFSLPTS